MVVGSEIGMKDEGGGGQDGGFALLGQRDMHMR